MKEKNSATASTLGRILATCSKQARDYGSCVASKVHEVEKDMCSKEFLALKNCIEHTVRSSVVPGRNFSSTPSSNESNKRVEYVSGFLFAALKGLAIGWVIVHLIESGYLEGLQKDKVSKPKATDEELKSKLEQISKRLSDVERVLKPNA